MEIVFLSLLVSSLGIEAVLFGSWLCAYQVNLDEQFEEEETLTRYESPNNLSNAAPSSPAEGSLNPAVGSGSMPEWEYKIVRTNRDLFRNPAIFQKLCREEAEVGWVLLEKLDDRRVRFKRPAGNQPPAGEGLPHLDPYRSYYGSSINFTSWLAALAFLMAIILPAYLGFALVSTTLNRFPENLPNSPLLNRDASP
ncbi:MAG: hypothetical protein HC835_06615 [Oscillatoriales cyanobacterium RM2_1_1]|nr:hypothetical protein [Oscillatoriales cyanobacterium SM2_3_0]NJO45321.1 hypothetical protein [Oscillatoriales cyanobacterium RM2_1_1]